MKTQCDTGSDSERPFRKHRMFGGVGIARRLALIASLTALLCTAGAPSWAALSFDFSFGGFCTACDPLEEPGIVEGTIAGLLDDTDAQEATSVIVTSAPDFLSSLIGKDFANPESDELLVRHSFSVQSGAISDFEFAFFRVSSPAAAFCLNDTVGLCSLNASSLFIEGAGAVRTLGSPGIEGVIFDQSNREIATAVPIPASAALVLIGLFTMMRGRYAVVFRAR